MLSVAVVEAVRREMAAEVVVELAVAMVVAVVVEVEVAVAGARCPLWSPCPPKMSTIIVITCDNFI